MNVCFLGHSSVNDGYVFRYSINIPVPVKKKSRKLWWAAPLASSRQYGKKGIEWYSKMLLFPTLD